VCSLSIYNVPSPNSLSLPLSPSSNQIFRCNIFSLLPIPFSYQNLGFMVHSHGRGEAQGFDSTY